MGLRHAEQAPGSFFSVCPREGGLLKRFESKAPRKRTGSEGFRGIIPLSRDNARILETGTEIRDAGFLLSKCSDDFWRLSGEPTIYFSNSLVHTYVLWILQDRVALTEILS
jgi:hypothetical protein